MADQPAHKSADKAAEDKNLGEVRGRKAGEPERSAEGVAYPSRSDADVDYTQQVADMQAARAEHSDVDKEAFEAKLGEDWDLVTDPNAPAEPPPTEGGAERNTPQNDPPKSKS